MPRLSPLRSASGESISVCGKLLRKGQTLTVPASAVGPRERTAIARKQLGERKSNKAGHVQLVVL